jgi:aspartokinase/homoserine dehydrogenase 1
MVLKFGGTSVGSPAALEKLREVVKEKAQTGKLKAVVVSAFSGVTNQLIEMASLAEKGNENYKDIHKQVENRHIEACNLLFPAQTRSSIIAQVMRLANELDDILQGIFLLGECSARSLDLVMSFGERLSAFLVKEFLCYAGLPAQYLDAREIISTNRNFGQALPDFLQTEYQIRHHFAQMQGFAVVTGFIGKSHLQETTTLGRGGSDYTAAILGAALGVGEILIYSDVNGMMTADPKMVSKAFTMSQISYQEAMELSHFGAKVIYPPSLQPAFARQIPIRLLNTFEAGHPGTLITNQSGENPYAITGLSSIKEIALINVQGTGLVGVAGFASRLFSALGKEKINVILITQASSEHSITFAVAAKEAEASQMAIASEFAFEMENGKLDPIEIQKEVSILAIIGERMKAAPGVSGKVFGTLGKNGVNIMATAQGSSELNISVVIPAKDMRKALNALHQTFFAPDRKILHVFLVGPGLIGKTFLNQLAQQTEFLHQARNLEIELNGIANSRQMICSEESISLSYWKENLENQGDKVDLASFLDKILNLNLPNSVLVDCTSGADVIPFYARFLERSVAVVTPNKLANSASLSQYRHLKNSALKGNTHFLYETNVGAGLPVVQTLQNLIHSGDRLDRIEAILSGTLSFIFNQFRPGVSFHDVVWAAKEAGYTEPDPRDDLSGKDMARKILILAREAGLPLEMTDVEPDNFLPKACLEAKDVSSFFESLKLENSYFEKLVSDAQSRSHKVKFICKLENDKVTVRLEEIDSSHPFWNSSGADNIIAFYTARYSQRPLVVQGPGAGAEVTAAGVFADVISLAG